MNKTLIIKNGLPLDLISNGVNEIFPCYPQIVGGTGYLKFKKTSATKPLTLSSARGNVLFYDGSNWVSSISILAATVGDQSVRIKVNSDDGIIFSDYSTYTLFENTTWTALYLQESLTTSPVVIYDLKQHAKRLNSTLGSVASSGTIKNASETIQCIFGDVNNLVGANGCQNGNQINIRGDLSGFFAASSIWLYGLHTYGDLVCMLNHISNDYCINQRKENDPTLLTQYSFKYATGNISVISHSTTTKVELCVNLGTDLDNILDYILNGVFSILSTLTLYGTYSGNTPSKIASIKSLYPSLSNFKINGTIV